MNDSIDELTKFEALYSGSSANNFREFKTAALNGIDKSFEMIHEVYDVCGVAVSSLNTFSDAYTGQLNLFNDWINKLDVSKDGLFKTGSTFTAAFGYLTALSVELMKQYKNDEQAISRVIETINQSNNNIDEIKIQLREDIRSGSDIKILLNEAKIYMDLDMIDFKNDILQIIDKVIIKCNQYRTIHNVFFSK